MSKFGKIFQAIKKKFCKGLVFYFSFYLVFSPLFSFQVFAQTLPINPVENNAVLGTSSNNIPVLNITKPTTSGVSVNKFNDFNVGKEGLIVNNLNLQDYNITYKSSLSNQHVEFNPNFRDGDSAKIILNEVVSNAKTLMNGYTEIYGRKADYIVANPNGITCNGCGFINTSRLSLITGNSNIVNGDIESFKISPTAQLRINGVGVENFGFYSSSPADLVSNAIKISGEVLSNNDLRILSGNDKYDWQNQTIFSTDKYNPEVAVDVSALGGMKAGNISIIASQRGFGINLDGNLIADTGNIEITADGEIKVKNLVAHNNIVAISNDKITAIDDGELVSNNLIYFDAGNILLNKSKLVSNDIYMLSNKDFINNIGTINSNNDLFIGVNGNFINSSSIISKNNFELQVLGNISNKTNANLLAYNDFDIITNNDLENIGKINTGNNLFISALNLNNYGQILSNKDMDLYIGNDLINYRGSGILAGNDMYINVANNLINYKADIYAEQDLIIQGRDDLTIDYQALDTNKTYDNPYIEKEVDPNTAEVSIPFTYTDTPEDEEVNLTIILENGETVDISPDIISDDAQAGESFELNGYTFIIGEESITEIDVPNPEYQNCVDDTCNGIPQTIKQKVYNYTGNDKLTIKDSNGNNISYTESIPAGDPNDEQVILNNTNTITSNTLNNFQTFEVDYPFINNFLNNFLNYAGKIEAKRNIEISANSITNKGFDYNTGDKAVTKKYNKIRDKACGWLCGWKVLGQEEIKSINLNSLPSSIVAGGIIALNATKNILNQNSILSSKGDMFIKTNNLQNLTTSEIVNFAVNMQRIKLRKKGWKIRKKRKNKTEISKKRIYNKQRATILSGGNLSISANTIKNDQDINPNGDIVATVSNKIIENGKVSVDIELPVGNNGLFKVSEGGKYLIENNVPFINVENYVGSGYFFEGLGNFLDGIDIIKILGDPAYETKIVMDAIVKSTQQHYLANDGSIGSDAEQMKQLYDNALEVYEDLGLKVGIALNENQIQNLQKDIIWYVTKEVNGEKVLVPELYLSQATLDAIDNNNASKISGFNVGIESDFVSNYGDVKASNVLSIKSNNLINESNDDGIANIKSNGLTTIEAKNIANLSGNIEGQITQITADNLINQTKVLSSDYDDKYELKKHTEIAGNTATINGVNGVSLDIDNALVNSGAKIESKNGDVNIKAGTATFNTIQLHNREESKKTSDNLVSKKTKISIKDTIENKESEINAGGNFILTTSGDANFAGANVNVGGDALLDIGGNTNITAVKDREYNYNKTSKSILGGVYSKKDTVIDENEILKNSNITVKDGLNIVSNKDVNVIASNIDVGGDANILAGYKLTENGIEKTESKANVNIINDIETSSHYEEHKKVNGLDFDNFDISASNGKISANVDVSSANTNELKENTNNVISSNLNIGGNLNLATTNDITIKASNINTSANTSLNADNDINIINDFNTLSKENIKKDITTSVGATAGNAYVDVAYATKALIDAEQSVEKAKKELSEIKSARDRGEASSEAVKDAELNLSLAIINFTNAEIALASSIAGSATAAASSYGTGFYASFSLTDDIDKYTENSISSQTVGSNLTAENILFKSGNNMTQIGSDIVVNDTISYDIANKLKILAGENTYRSESYNEHITAGASYGNNAVQGNVGYNQSRDRASGTSFTNSNILAENISIKTGSNAEFVGANVNANETLIASVGGDLIIESKQDTDYAKGKNLGINLSVGGGVKDEAKGKNSSGFGVNSGLSNHDSSWVNDMTELTAKNVNIDVAGKTSLTGAMIDGSESLHLATNELEFKDLHDFERSNETGYGVSTSVGITTNKGETNLHPNGKTSLTLKDTGNDKEQITRATIGEGVIEVAGGSDLTDLNRDTSKAQEITKDITTGALDASASIDNRVFTSEGRADIVKQHENLGKNLSQIGNGLRNNIITKTIENTITGDKSLSENFYDYVEQDRQMTELKENRKDLMLALNGMTNFDSEEAKDILQQIADLTAGENGFSGKLQLANVEGNIAGFSYQSDDGEVKNITINLANVDLTKPNELIDVIYHETTNFEEHNRKEQNAINRGKTGAGIFSLKNFGNENTNGMSNTEWIIANADKDTISNGNLGLVSDLYNTATKKGEGEPFIISSIVTGLVVTGSLYSIQDSARKIYAWIDGKGYKGNTTYIDPIDGRIYTAEENLKEGAIELAAAATAGIAVKGVGKVVSKAKATKTLSKAKAAKTLSKAKATKNTKITGSKSANSVKSVKNLDNNLENFIDNNKIKKGGIYSDVRTKNKGGEVHHLIADSVSEIPRNDAPSILMTKSDHMQTKSWGNSNVSKAFRDKQKNLVNQGKNRDALAIGIKDVRSQFSSKYNKELLEAIDSTKNNQKINQIFKK